MAIYPREDARTALPQLEKKFTTMADEFNKKMDGMLDFFYPVGSYYETSDTDFDPNVKWGGTWELELAGMVHVSAGTGYTVSGANTNTKDGGNATETLALTQIPSHNHNSRTVSGWFNIRGNSTSAVMILSVSGGVVTRKDVTWSGSHSHVDMPSGTNPNYETVTINATHTHDAQGGGQAHNNMQPYIIVNRWHRTA